MAELKQDADRAPQAAGLGLHGFTAVAELKHHPGLLVSDDAGLSPRLHRRGRIEAPTGDTATKGTAIRLHGFTAVAELKRLDNLPTQLVCSRGLHGFTAVAELKRHDAFCWRDAGSVVSTASPPWPN